MTLYEINNEMKMALDDVLNSVDEETGEVDESYVHILEDLQMQRDEKLDNIGAYIKNLAAEAEAIKTEEKKLAERRKATENKVERLKNYVAEILNGEKFESSRVAFSFRRSEQVVIPDEEHLDERYLVREVTWKPDKKAIKEAIKSGELVVGAYLETKNNLQIK